MQSVPTKYMPFPGHILILCNSKILFYLFIYWRRLVNEFLILNTRVGMYVWNHRIRKRIVFTATNIFFSICNIMFSVLFLQTSHIFPGVNKRTQSSCIFYEIAHYINRYRKSLTRAKLWRTSIFHYKLNFKLQDILVSYNIGKP